MQKGRKIIAFWANFFFFCRIELIFGELTYCDLKSIVALSLFLLIYALFARNEVWKKISF